MRLLIAALSFFALIATADAGTITLTVQTAAAPCNVSPYCTKTYTDTDAHLGAIATALASQCLATNGSACSITQIITWWFNQVIANLTTQVNSQLYSQAAQALTPVVIAPQ